MIFQGSVLYFTCFVLVFSGAAFVDTLGKCSINDGDCQRKLFQGALIDIAKTGVPELDIPPIDPIRLKNVSVSVVNLLDIQLIDGVAKGVKDCIINEFTNSIDKQHASMDITCDIIIKGHYKVSASSPLIKNLFGSDAIRGDGSAKVKIDKLNLKMDFFYYVQKLPNGDNLLKCRYNEIKYKYEILDKVTFSANNLFLENQEVSTVVMAFLNENWKMVMDSFGKTFFDKAMEYVYKYSHKFFDVVPTKEYILEDLTPYATK